MVGDLAADELGLAGVAGALVVGAGELDRRLDRLRAARGEEDAIQVAGRQRRDPGRELDRPRVRVAPDGEEVELGDLARGGLAELRPAVARVDAEERREAVEIAVALLVPHVRTLAADDDRHVGIVVGAVPREVHPQVALGELLEIRARWSWPLRWSLPSGSPPVLRLRVQPVSTFRINRIQPRRDAQPGLGSKMLPPSCTNRITPFCRFGDSAPCARLRRVHTLVGLSG